MNDAQVHCEYKLVMYAVEEIIYAHKIKQVMDRPNALRVSSDGEDLIGSI